MSDRVVLSVDVREGGMIVSGPANAGDQVERLVNLLKADGITAIVGDALLPPESHPEERHLRLKCLTLACDYAGGGATLPGLLKQKPDEADPVILAGLFYQFVSAPGGRDA